METTTSMFPNYLRLKLHQFIIHKFVARWQDTQCRSVMVHLPSNCILSHIDFVENYTFQIQSEIQSMFWHSFQVIILVHITYIVDLANGSNDEGQKVIKDNNFYISDDKEHDILFVQHYLLQHWNWFTNQDVTQHIVWNDGCASQFKGS